MPVVYRKANSTRVCYRKAESYPAAVQPSSSDIEHRMGRVPSCRCRNRRNTSRIDRLRAGLSTTRVASLLSRPPVQWCCARRISSPPACWRQMLHNANDCYRSRPSQSRAALRPSGRRRRTAHVGTSERKSMPRLSGALGCLLTNNDLRFRPRESHHGKPSHVRAMKRLPQMRDTLEFLRQTL